MTDQNALVGQAISTRAQQVNLGVKLPCNKCSKQRKLTLRAEVVAMGPCMSDKDLYSPKGQGIVAQEISINPSQAKLPPPTGGPPGNIFDVRFNSSVVTAETNEQGQS